ncbi:MAG: hypothetical protein QME96_04880 [Myxococcota bacterium]|nr:hypothetical protein [Myxococcota bacterium]
MPRTLPELLAPLDEVLVRDANRAAVANSAGAGAARLVARLPVVHRTAKPAKGAPDDREARWTDIFAEQRIEAGEVKTAAERENGFHRAVYLFFGCGPFPERPVAIILPAEPFLDATVTFTPFDSGALDDPPLLIPVEETAPWAAADRARFLGEHLGSGADLRAFAGPCLAAHFRDPLDYVRRPQQEQPDFPPYHGLHDDRRSWTLEMQVHDDVDLGAASPLRVVVRDESLFMDLKPFYFDPVRVAGGDVDRDDGVGAAVADEIVALIAGVA